MKYVKTFYFRCTLVKYFLRYRSLYSSSLSVVSTKTHHHLTLPSSHLPTYRPLGAYEVRTSVVHSTGHVESHWPPKSCFSLDLPGRDRIRNSDSLRAVSVDFYSSSSIVSAYVSLFEIHRPLLVLLTLLGSDLMAEWDRTSYGAERSSSGLTSCIIRFYCRCLPPSLFVFILLFVWRGLLVCTFSFITGFTLCQLCNLTIGSLSRRSSYKIYLWIIRVFPYPNSLFYPIFLLFVLLTICLVMLHLLTVLLLVRLLVRLLKKGSPFSVPFLLFLLDSLYLLSSFSVIWEGNNFSTRFCLISPSLSSLAGSWLRSFSWEILFFRSRWLGLFIYL